MEDSEEPSTSSPQQCVSENPRIKYVKPNRAAFAQVLATLIQNWLLMDIGIMMAIPTLIIGALHTNSTEAPLVLNDDEASWFGSLQSLCHPFGSLTSGLVQEYFGRKGTMILINIPMFAAWLILSFGNSVYTLYAFSVITGLCVGLLEASHHSYIGEIGEPHLRGTLSTITSAAGCLGSFLTFFLGYMFKWRTVALICSAIPVITFFSIIQIPESPSWLIVRGRLEEAKKSLCWLRGWVKPQEVKDEFKALVSYTTNSAKQSQIGSDASENNIVKKAWSLKTELQTLMERKVLLPLRMVFIVFVISFAAVVMGMRPYKLNELIYLETPIDVNLYMVMGDVLLLVGITANVIFLRRVGRRKLALFSFTIAAVVILGIGAYTSFLRDAVQFPARVWFPAIISLILNFLNGFSLVLLPWQLVCEIFPLSGRGTATGISASWAHFVDFAMTKSYLYLRAWLNFDGVMYLYGACTVLGVGYFYFYLPETEGKSLEQIESYFTENHDQKEKFSMGNSKKDEKA